MEERYIESVLSEFFSNHYREELLGLEETRKDFVVIDFAVFSVLYPDVAEELLSNPKRVIDLAEFVLSSELKSRGGKDDIRVRFNNLPKSRIMGIGQIRKDDLGKFIFIEGIVKKKGEIRPFLDITKFECRSCDNIFPYKHEDFLKKPNCPVCKKSNLLFEVDKTLIDKQKLVIEEMPELLDGSDQPKRIGVVLKEDLTSFEHDRETNPGSRIRVVGFVKEIPEVSGGKKTGRYEIEVMCNYVESLEPSAYDVVISKEEEEELIEISKDPKLHSKLIASLSPTTYGYNRIKEALVYQILSGVRKEKSGGVSIRGDIHILLVGDPGAGKSQLLKRVSNVVPKSRYVAGKSSSGAGLTATVVKDEAFGGWTLEAGALVITNGGLVCVDEMDKMDGEDRSSMHEAMEQQTVSISKATIQATLLARTSVLAAANPKMGRFDPSDTIAKQIDLPASLINRFDLIFTIFDNPDRNKDSILASHILETHKGDDKDDSDLVISDEVFKKYLSYARQKFFPKIGEEAINSIRDYYVSARANSSNTISISPRQLEALVRMSEASAKSRLSDVVTKEDAEKAIDLLKYCLMSVGYDSETGEIDIDRLGGVPASRRNKIKVVKKIIQELETELGELVPDEDVIKRALDLKTVTLSEYEIEEIIETLKREGDFFTPKPGFIKRVG